MYSLLRVVFKMKSRV